VPVPGLTHLEATAIQVTLAGKPVLILAAYLSPSQPLIGTDLTACFGGALPVLMIFNASFQQYLKRRRVNFNTTHNPDINGAVIE